MENTQQFPKTSLDRILFCTDFSQNADFAFNYAVDAAMKRENAKLYLLHVIPESESQFWKQYIYEVEGVDIKAKHDIDARIEEAYRSKLPAGMEMEVQCRVGKDSEQILEYAREMDIDLIVLGRQGHGSLTKALSGNVSEKIVRKAHCAVMVIPYSNE
ncbi:MAG: universal stress protein [Sedimentisphaeraceae bacterium JB056]